MAATGSERQRGSEPAITAPELRRLIDEREIRDVLARYCRGIDRMDADLVRSCYHDAAVDHHGSFHGNIDEYMLWVWRVLSRYTSTMHFLGNILVEFAPARAELARADLARAETYGIAFHRTDGGAPAGNLIVGFRFIDRFERRHGSWRIARRVATTEWVQMDTPDRHWPIPPDMLRGSRDRTDPVYADWDDEHQGYPAR
jgi:hypothetical protein